MASTSSHPTTTLTQTPALTATQATSSISWVKKKEQVLNRILVPTN